MQSIIEMKDNILQSIDAESDVAAIINCRKAAIFLELAGGFFTEASYLYKGEEIANRAIERLARIDPKMTVFDLTDLFANLRKQEQRYHEAHYASKM